jgi:hypothetical protein
VCKAAQPGLESESRERERERERAGPNDARVTAKEAGKPCAPVKADVPGWKDATSTRVWQVARRKSFSESVIPAGRRAFGASADVASVTRPTDTYMAPLFQIISHAHVVTSHLFDREPINFYYPSARFNPPFCLDLR